MKFNPGSIIMMWSSPQWFVPLLSPTPTTSFLRANAMLRPHIPSYSIHIQANMLQNTMLFGDGIHPLHGKPPLLKVWNPNFFICSFNNTKWTKYLPKLQGIQLLRFQLRYKSKKSTNYIEQVSRCNKTHLYSATQLLVRLLGKIV